jgi:hypothetical protein
MIKYIYIGNRVITSADFMSSFLRNSKTHDWRPSSEAGPSTRRKRHHQQQEQATTQTTTTEITHRCLDVVVAATTDSKTVPAASGRSKENDGDLYKGEMHQRKSGREHHHQKRVKEQEPSNDSSKTKRVKRRKCQKESLTSPTRVQRKSVPMPLNGYVVSVSTLQSKEAVTSPEIESGSSESKRQDQWSLSSYQEVCKKCRDLGATVSELVSKRVMALVCSREAANQATQRVRKSIKRRIPILSVEWIVACHQQGKLVNMESYRLDSEAVKAINRRQNERQKQSTGTLDNDDRTEPFDSPLTKVIELGCCCICHEQGTTANCPWCKECQTI